MSGVRETQASTRGVRKVELVSNRGLGEESDSTAGEEKQKGKKEKEKRKRGRKGKRKTGDLHIGLLESTGVET
jgi:hypothetical protein